MKKVVGLISLWAVALNSLAGDWNTMKCVDLK